MAIVNTVTEEARTAATVAGMAAIEEDTAEIEVATGATVRTTRLIRMVVATAAEATTTAPLPPLRPRESLLLRHRHLRLVPRPVLLTTQRSMPSTTVPVLAVLTHTLHTAVMLRESGSPSLSRISTNGRQLYADVSAMVCGGTGSRNGRHSNRAGPVRLSSPAATYRGSSATASALRLCPSTSSGTARCRWI